MSTPSQDLITALTPKGWTFSQSSSRAADTSDILVYWQYRSPRLTSNAIIPDHFDEEGLMLNESTAYARQQHGPTIAVTLSQVSAGLIAQLATLYRLIDRGVAGAVIPNEITMNDLHIPLVIDGRAL